MDDLNKKLIFFVLAVGVAGCGVKGRPNPPKNPPSLGRGEPMYKETKKKNTPVNGAIDPAVEGAE